MSEKELSGLELETVAAGKGGQIAQQSGGGTSLFLSQAAPSVVKQNVVVGGGRGARGRGRGIKIR